MREFHVDVIVAVSVDHQKVDHVPDTVGQISWNYFGYQSPIETRGINGRIGTHHDIIYMLGMSEIKFQQPALFDYAHTRSATR